VGGSERDELTIGELARRAGIKTSALRYYDELGLVRPARRVSGRRRYGRDAIDRLAVLQMAQRSGFTLAEIQVLMADFDARAPTKPWRTMAREKLGELADRVAELERMRAMLREGLECDCLDLRACATLALDREPGRREA